MLVDDECFDAYPPSYNVCATFAVATFVCARKWSFILDLTFFTHFLGCTVATEFLVIHKKDNTVPIKVCFYPESFSIPNVSMHILLATHMRHLRLQCLPSCAEKIKFDLDVTFFTHFHVYFYDKNILKPKTKAILSLFCFGPKGFAK
jgi:hypothetical protein